MWSNFKGPTNLLRLSLFEPGLHPDKCARVNVASHTAAIRASFLEVVSKPQLASDSGVVARIAILTHCRVRSVFIPRDALLSNAIWHFETTSTRVHSIPDGNQLAANHTHLTADTHGVLASQVVIRRLMFYGREENISYFLIRASLSEVHF